MDVFDLQAKISLDTSGYKKALSAAAGDMQAFGSTVEGIVGAIGTAFTTAFAAASAGTAALVKGAVEEYARFEQLVGGVDTLFKDSSDALQANADAAYQTAGKSANDYMDVTTSFAASLIQALGGDTAAAVDMVDMAVTDMADNINTFGGDMTMVENAYKGFARNSYVMLDNLKLGYSGTKSEMARLINDTGILGDTVVTVSTMTEQGNFDQVVSFATVVEAIHAVQENLGITGRTAQEASSTIEGSAASMKAAWSNWLVGLGDENADLSGLTDSLVSSFETVIDNVVPVVGRIGESLMQVFSDLTGIDLTPVTEVFDGLKTTLSDIGTAFAEGGVTGAFDEITGKLSELTGLDLSGVTEAFTGIGEAISTIGAGFAEGGLGGGFDALVGQIEQLTGLDLSGVTETFNSLSEAFANIGTAFAKGGLEDGITAIVGALESATGIDLTGLVDGVKGFIGGLMGIDAGTVQTIADSVAVFIGSFKDSAIAELIQAVADKIGEFFAALGEVSPGIIDTIAKAIYNFSDSFEQIAPWILAVVGAILSFNAAALAMKVIPAVMTLVSGALTAFQAILAAFAAANPIALIATAIGLLVTALVTAYNTCENFRNSVDALWNSFKEGAASAIDTFKETLAGIGDAISEAASEIKGKIGEFISAGRELIQGLVNGITEKLSTVKEAVSGAVSQVTDWVKGVFDINSPSRVFAEIGRNLMRGLAVGVDDESGIVQDSIDKLRLTVPPVTTGRIDFADSAIGKASAATVNGMFASAGASSGGAQTINLVVDGRTLAQVVFDPLNGMIRQKGVAFGA